MSELNQNIAMCACRAVQVAIEGKPFNVFGCFCKFCQRGGTSLPINGWFKKEQLLSVSGMTKVYSAMTDSAMFKATEFEGSQQQVDYHFCGNCGSTVYWFIPMLPGMLSDRSEIVMGVAMGCFDINKDCPAPSSYHYVENRVDWLDNLSAQYMYEGMPTIVQKRNEIRSL